LIFVRADSAGDEKNQRSYAGPGLSSSENADIATGTSYRQGQMLFK